MTRKNLKHLLLLLAVIVVASACERNGTEPQTITPPAKEKFQELRAKALEGITQTKTFKAEDGLVFTSQKGAVLTIDADCLTDESGNAVSGDVQLSFVEIYDRGNMVVTNKPVMAKDPAGSGNSVPLITGGQFSIEIKQGNKILKSACYYSLDVSASLTGGVDNEMILWDGTINENTGNLIYEEVVGREAGLNINEKGTTYSVFNNDFRWTNIDKFWEYTGPKTKIKVTVPDGYNGDNAAVYVAFEDEENALAQLDVYNTQEKYFTEHYGYLPVGKKVHVIFVSEHNSSVVYAIREVTIVANQTLNIASSDLQTTSLSILIGLINNL